jgi:DNA-binding NarL/FixJ family response regulator
MKVLIVDNHLLFREGLASILGAGTDFDVVGHAGTCREAVEQAAKLQPDVVLMDMQLPDGSGLEALQQIVARRPECQVVMLTSVDSDEFLFEAFRAGARGYALKSMSSAKLVKALNALKQGEPLLSRQMMRRILEEFSRLGRNDGASILPTANLTARELEVLRHLGTGASNHEIAARLVISQNTVKVHVRNIREKLDLKTRSQAANFATRNGLANSSRQHSTSHAS